MRTSVKSSIGAIEAPGRANRSYPDASSGRSLARSIAAIRQASYAEWTGNRGLNFGVPRIDQRYIALSLRIPYRNYMHDPRQKAVGT
jgi:hypothetical protein